MEDPLLSDPFASGLLEKLREKSRAPVRRKQREEELEHERKLREVRKGPPANQVVWTGTAREFGDMVDDLYLKKKKIKANSRTDAMKQMCRHFVPKDGKRFDAKSIMQSLKNRKEIEGKAP